MMAITTNSSMRVKPRCRFMGVVMGWFPMMRYTEVLLYVSMVMVSRRIATAFSDYFGFFTKLHERPDPAIDRARVPAYSRAVPRTTDAAVRDGMLSGRPILVGMAWAALLVQPACLSAPWGSTPPRQMPTAPTPAGTDFASVIRAPGDFQLTNDPAAVVRHREETAGPVVAQSVGVEPIVVAPQLRPPPDPPLVAAVRAFLDNRHDEAVEHLKALDKPNQELMLQLIPAVVRASQINLAKAGPTELGMLAGQLESPAAALAARGPLGLDKACFCRSVSNFGRYSPLSEGYAFRPGAVAELYVEVRNVPSEPSSAPGEEGFVTKLHCTLQVRDGTGTVVELLDRNGKPVPALHVPKRDVTRSPIRDYFLLFRFPVPTKPGSYAVTVEVADPATGRAVSRTMPLRVQ